MRIDLDDRSSPQNAYYWSVVIPALADLWRLDREQAHVRVKSQFNDNRSTAKLTTISFERLMVELRAYAQAWGMQIPPPSSSGGPENELLS